MPKVGNVLKDNVVFLDSKLKINNSFDIVSRQITIGGRDACMYLIDGFCKDEMMQKFLQFLMEIKAEDMPGDLEGMTRQFMPYVEVDIQQDFDQIIYFILSGTFALFIDGFDQCILIDARTYPSRSVEEPEKDKALRGSKDGFVETIVFNTALIRRRIRSTELCMELLNAGTSSQTDIVVCYMQGRVDTKLLHIVKEKIQNIKIDALTMNQETLAECLYKKPWYNPYPKFKYTERPDAAAAHILEGNIVILVDNSPSAMVIPTSLFDLLEEADDFYFPPITGTYLRLTRMLISLLTYLLTPTFLLLMMRPEWIPDTFAFIRLKEAVNLPILWQFLLLELAIDGLKLAAVNTPNMLSTPLSVLAALVLGEFAVESGWFSGEVMLYMAFVAIANYTQSNYELGYAIKFQRILTLLLTAVFGGWGYLAGIILCVLCLVFNKTIGGRGYLYPLLPWDWEQLKKRLLRHRMM
ncbi:MAG: spore germination protein [Lachnospiraceae bacterium]|nr:spore germination protein [Lachnospiraceae bacterium]